LTIIRAILRSLLAVIRKQAVVPDMNPAGGRLGLPADFLISSEGRILECKYGTHAYDQWSVDELLHLATAERQIVDDDSSVTSPAGVVGFDRLRCPVAAERRRS
jgi:hypothetical protein